MLARSLTLSHFQGYEDMLVNLAKPGTRVDSGNLPAGKLPEFTGIFRLPLPVFVPKLPEFRVSLINAIFDHTL